MKLNKTYTYPRVNSRPETTTSNPNQHEHENDNRDLWYGYTYWPYYAQDPCSGWDYYWYHDYCHPTPEPTQSPTTSIPTRVPTSFPVPDPSSTHIFPCFSSLVPPSAPNTHKPEHGDDFDHEGWSKMAYAGITFFIAVCFCISKEIH